MILYYLFSFKTGEQVFLHQKEERKYSGIKKGHIVETRGANFHG